MIKMTSGTIIEDPLQTVPIGGNLQIQTIPVITDFSGQTASLVNWDYFDGLLLSITFRNEIALYVEGSAVLVAPGIALCASHVIEPRQKELQSGAVRPLCQGIAQHGLNIWHIRKVTMVGNSDLTILSLELASELPPNNLFTQAKITTRTPKVGEELLLCGFRASEDRFPLDNKSAYSSSGEVRISKGTVTAQYLRGRDTAMIPWPVVEVSCPVKGGMSGGPVFDMSGHLIGIICSSIEISESEGVSYVSLLWPALTANFEGSWLNGIFPTPTSLLELSSKICTIERPDAISKIPHEDSKNFDFAYNCWEG